MLQKNIWVENTMETRYTMEKVEFQVILLGLSAVSCLDLLILLFQREVCVFLCIRRQLCLAELLFNHDKAVFL